jgi:hypothetical protein
MCHYRAWLKITSIPKKPAGLASAKTNGITVLFNIHCKKNLNPQRLDKFKELLLRSALDLRPHQCQRNRGNGTMRSFPILSHDLAIKSLRIYGHTAHTGK